MGNLRTGLVTAAFAALIVGAPAYALDAPADPLAGLTAEVSAVLYTDLAPRLVLIDKANGSRTLRVGDEYRDGWKLVSATSGSATLRKGAQTREVLFKPQSAPAEVTGESGVGSIALTNAVIGGSPQTTPPLRPELDTIRANLEEKYGAGYLQALTERTGISAERVLEMTARGVPPPPPPPPPLPLPPPRRPAPPN